LRSLARLPRGITKVSGVCESSVLLAGSLGVVSKTLSNYSGSSVVSKLLFLRRKKIKKRYFSYISQFGFRLYLYPRQ